MKNFKRILSFLILKILIFFFIDCLLYSQQKVLDVEFIGLKNVKPSEVKSKIKTKKGSYFSKENIRDDIESLLTTEYFDNVEVDFDTTTKKLVYKFIERPKIRKIEVRGNKKVSTVKIKEEIPLKEKEFFAELKLIESKNKILSLYDEKGYNYTIVDTETILNKEKNEINIIFLINEGKRFTVSIVDVFGNQNISKRKILSLMETKKKKIFRENKINSDLEKIVEHYKDNGFYDVEISTVEVKFDETEEKVKIFIKISEGIKYKIADINFIGNDVYSEKELTKVIPLKKNRIYKQTEVDASIQSIAELYAEKGYLKVNVVPEINKDSILGKIYLTFNITEGEVVYVDKIYIDGLVSTKEEVIRREILLKEGDVFSSKKLRRSIQKIYNLGFLDDVKIDLQPGSRIDSVDLVFDITEGRPGMLSAGAGYSSVDKLVGNLQVSHLNLFGRAQRLNLLWEFGERRQNYEISWTEPWFLKKPMSLGFSLYDLIRTREYSNITNAYKEERQGGEIRLGPRISDEFGLSFSYSYENVIISESQFPEDIPNGKKITSSFASQLVYDSRDYIYDASKGMRHSLTLQFAGWGILGGDVKFYKPIIRSSIFIPTFWKFVLSFNAVGGYIEGVDGYDLENVKYEKFYVGGAETVRGYGYRMLAPENGGRIMFVFNTEYKFPIVQENKRTILQGAIFYDIGGAWNEFKDVNFTIGADTSWEESAIWDNKLKHSIGFGIRFTTPVFPIRLDWSWALNPVKSRDRLQFWFTLGQMF
ncbi:MAG: outer membrane protein assembly factor BamA [Endomicrobiia bacterium]